MEKRVDLHLHSYYSDGTNSPEEILEKAEKAGIGTIAITDHEVLEGARELLALSEKRGIRCVAGVELTAYENGETFHILGYGIDLSQEKLWDFAKANRRALDLVSVRLVEKMEKDFPEISLEDYEEYRYDRRGGGWKALHYFKDRGISGSLSESRFLYGRYGQTYEDCGFAGVSDCCKAIHESGGVAVFAHPYQMIPYEDLAVFREKLLAVLDQGLDGIECFYPGQPEEVTALCLEVCRERNLFVTSGSDSHGDFEVANTPIGTGTATERVLASVNPCRDNPRKFSGE